jgi:hypothetical protein
MRPQTTFDPEIVDNAVELFTSMLSSGCYVIGMVVKLR